MRASASKLKRENSFTTTQDASVDDDIVTTSKTPLVRKPNKLFNATTINSPKNNDKINIQSGQEVLETIFEKARRDRDTAVKELKKMVDRDLSVDKDQRPLKRD